jgi:hypothetical protein
MLANASVTLKELAKIGYKELESAKSEKGDYYALKPKEIKKLPLASAEAGPKLFDLFFNALSRADS